jgi:hypothetical protein
MEEIAGRSSAVDAKATQTRLRCAPLLVDLFLYSYESEFLQNLVKDKKIREARAFNFTYRYIDYAISINNPR